MALLGSGRHGSWGAGSLPLTMPSPSASPVGQVTLFASGIQGAGGAGVGSGGGLSPPVLLRQGLACAFGTQALRGAGSVLFRIASPSVSPVGQAKALALGRQGLRGAGSLRLAISSPSVSPMVQASAFTLGMQGSVGAGSALVGMLSPSASA